jgi:hypothetical protein
MAYYPSLDSWFFDEEDVDLEEDMDDGSFYELRSVYELAVEDLRLSREDGNTSEGTSNEVPSSDMQLPSVPAEANEEDTKTHGTRQRSPDDDFEFDMSSVEKCRKT